MNALQERNMQVTFSFRYLGLDTYYTLCILVLDTAIFEFKQNVATQFEITLSQVLQDNHIINAVLINLPSFSSLLHNAKFTHSPKLCYI
jgi:hypothetical protein